jgi:endonuclease/exonuclease/phosphatase family metal-dependent hydrolase
MPEEFRGWVTAADVRGLPWSPGERPLRLFCLHTPTRKDGNYLGEVNRIIDIIVSMAHGHDVVVGGDFNITVSLRHESEPKQNALGEPEALRRLRRELGLINCWQTLHPNQVLPQTHQHKFQADSAPHHLDGLFVPATWYRYLDSCDVLNGMPWIGRSDHFPVVASFAS